jgi:hypothetical protein
MTDSTPSFIARIFLAFGVFFRFIFDPAFATAVQRLRSGAEPAAAVAPPEPKPTPTLEQALPDSALQLLGLLQQKGRLVDFLQEEVSTFSDEQVGAAARVVHEGCRQVLDEHFTLEPVRTEAEGSRVTLEKGFDASAVRLVGNVVGEPPFSGTLTHRGWRVQELRLPKIASGHDTHVVASAEVEL